MGELYYDGIEIRHEPDGELLFFGSKPIFDQDDVLNIIKNIMKSSNNFSVKGVHKLKTHTNFDNTLEIYRNQKDE